MTHANTRTLALSLLLAALGACHPGDGGSGGTPFVYSGVVRIPGGSGLVLAPDGTQVELVPIGAQGSPGPALASATTIAGIFTLEADARPASELAFVAELGAETLRALAVDERTQVDPFSETCVRLVLGSGADLRRFTSTEVRDLASSIELVGHVRGVELAGDLVAAVARLRDAALAEPGFADFLAAAAGAGQTASGPGDLGDFFPLRQDDLWGYHRSLTQGSVFRGETTLERRTLEQSGTTWSVRTRTALDEETAVVERFEESDTGVRRLAGGDVESLFGGVPEVRLAFPLLAGKTWLALEAVGAPFGSDVDFDHVPDAVDARLVRTVRGFEDVQTDDGIFENCARVDGSTQLVIHGSGGGDPRPGTLALSEWYAAGIGLVRRHEVLEVPSIGLSDETDEVLSGHALGGGAHGILPPVVLDPDLGTDNITMPRSASDGTNHLIAVLRDHGDVRPLLGLLVDSKGDVLRETELRPLRPPPPGDPQVVEVAFDGTNYVVAHTDQRLIWVQRVSPEGELLDPLPIQITRPNLHGGDFPIEMASDGLQTLLVWQHTETSQPDEIRGCFVTPGGSALGIFTLLSETSTGALTLVPGVDSYLLAFFGFEGVVAARISFQGEVLDPSLIHLDPHMGFVDQPELAVDFDGSSWLVVWKRKFGGFDDPTEHLVARRVAQDGTLLDSLAAPPIAITTSFAGKGYPALAFDGTNHLVAWAKTTEPSAVHLARLTKEGERLDGTSADDGLTILGPFEPGSGEHPIETILSRAGDHVLLHWLRFPGRQGAIARAESVTIHALD